MAFLKRRGTAIRLGTRLAFSWLLCCAGAQELEEYQVKAAYLYNFAKFVEWPTPSFKDGTSPIVICVLGEDPFAGALHEVVRGKTAAGRTLVVRPVADLPGARGCHMLFISATEWRLSRPSLRPLQGNAVLTVGETAGFSEGGGMIRFKLEQGRVRFEINVEAAQQGAIRISSKLLSLAEFVKR